MLKLKILHFIIYKYSKILESIDSFSSTLSAISNFIFQIIIILLRIFAEIAQI